MRSAKSIKNRSRFGVIFAFGDNLMDKFARFLDEGKPSFPCLGQFFRLLTADQFEQHISIQINPVWIVVVESKNRS